VSQSGKGTLCVPSLRSGQALSASVVSSVFRRGRPRILMRLRRGLRLREERLRSLFQLLGSTQTSFCEARESLRVLRASVVNSTFRSQLDWLMVLVSIGAAGCEKPDQGGKPPAIPGPAALVHGRVIRGHHPVAGVYVLTRITLEPGCRATDSAGGGTVVSATPTDSTGRFQTFAYREPGTGERTGCLHVGAADPVTAETAWAAPRPAPKQRPGAFDGNVPQVIDIDVPWPE
jgi:hypothetical protein